jgi:hypothetical protein
MIYGFYSKTDKNEEIVNRMVTFSRLQAAKLFAERKQLPLKSFLKIYSIKKVL